MKKDPDAEVRKSAIWISEDFMKTDNDNVVAKLADMADDPSADVRFQLALSLRYNQSEKAKAIIRDLVIKYPNGVLAESQKTYEAELAAKEAEAKKSA